MTVNVVAVAALLLTLVASVVLYRRFEKAKYSDQLKKDTLIARLEISIANLLKLEDLCSDGQIGDKDAIKLTTACRREFESFVRFARALSAPATEEQSAGYRLICADLKHLITNTPRRSEANPQLRVVKGVIQMTPDRVVEVERKVGEGKDILYEIQKSIILDLTY
jgi:hypothetical protein